MEVLKSNFEVNLPLIEEALSNADFIAIDTEFTGLTTPDVSFQNSDELPVRYSKIKNCVQEFTIIQYGVCAFKKNTDTGDYIAKPFNFYIFGADTNEVQSRRIFSATPSSLTFLRSNQFDFNKLIEEGIPFYNYSEESSMFQSTHGTNVVNRRSVISEASLTKSGKSFLEYNRKSIANWLEGNSEKPLIIQVNSAFYKKLIYQEIQDTKYNGFLKASPRDSKHLEISRVKEEDKRQSTVNTPKLNFRAVIDLIKKANCPVVAHNAAYDIFHTIDQFWQYLPNDVQEFKKVANSMWPNIVDTKYLAEFHPVLKSCFNTSVLGSLYNTVSSELQESGQDVVMAEGFDRYTGDGNGVEHEAGYDAYMTGVIYLAFIAFIREKDTDINHTNKRKRSLSEASGEESESEEESESDDDDVNDEEEKSEVKENNSDDEEVDDDSKEDGEKNDSSDAESSDGEISSDEDNGGDKAKSIFMDKAITPYYGRIYLMRSDIPYIDLKGEEQVNLVTYPNKFFLHNIPSGFTNTAIEKVYPNMVPFAVSWVNDNNAWIILRDETKIPHVKLGVVGLSSVHCFLPGCSRETEGEAYGITKEAGKMELITHEQWQILYGPKKTVDYSNTAEALRAATMNNITQNSEESVPTGGSGYDDLDIQLPPSFAASLKRSRDSSEDNDDASLPDAKNRKTASS